LSLRFPRTIRCILVTLLAALPLCTSPAQSGSPLPQTPHPGALTVTARLVVLDLVVRDAHGNPVTDLTANDFRIYEDEVFQTIRSFEPPSEHTLPAASAGMDTVFDPANPASFGRSPATVLVLDQLNTHFADSSFARRELHDYLAAQPAQLAQPTTLLTVYENNFKLLQGFTRDRDLLLKALAAAPTKYAWTLDTSGNADYGPVNRLEQSLHVLEQIAQSYARIPGRKNVLWIGGGFPTVDPTEFNSHDMQLIKDTIQHITDVLLATHVTFNAVDPSSSAAGMVEITTADQADAATAIGGSIGTNAGSFDANQDFDMLGPITGGRIVRGRNDIATQIGQAMDSGTSFYTIAYTPTSASASKVEFRKIRIVCLRPGVTVLTRSGYYSQPDQPEKAADTVSYDLSTAAESRLPLNGLRVTAVPATSVAEESGSYIVRVSAPGLTWKLQQDGTSVASVYVMASYFDAKSKLLGNVNHPMSAVAKPTTDIRDENKTADFSIAVPRSSRVTRLRFVVRDSATGKMGSFDLPVARTSK
jgi:VWFA-related protein